MSLEHAIHRVADALHRLADLGVRFLDLKAVPPMPGQVSIRPTGEITQTIEGVQMDKIKFVVRVPAEATGDVVRREVTVGFQGGASDTDTVPGREVGETKEFTGDQDSVVSVSVVNVDDAGNQSEPRVQEFTLADAFAPPEPGEVGLRATGEVTEGG